MSVEKLYPNQPVLMVDDEPTWLRSMAMALKVSAGINNVVYCSDSRDVKGLLNQQNFSLVLLDLTMPHLGGKEILGILTENYPEIPVIIISGINQIQKAIECMKLGAFDFFVKTDERERVTAGIERALRQVQLQNENQLLAQRVLMQAVNCNQAFTQIVTKSPKMLGIFEYLSAIAKSPEPVLITGESGVGKELIAKALHLASDPKAPWIAVNVAGLDNMAFSDTLFGHVKGAFTGADTDRPGLIEEAAGGILFLDEIGDLTPQSQVKLLRLLQEGEFYPLGSDRPSKNRARILTATNQDLATKEAKGLFRRDLLYRLRSHKVEIPPLRERREDLSLLLDTFFTETAQALDKKIPTVPPQLLTLLQNYSFPGNIRELRSLVYDAVSIHSGGVMSMHSFKDSISENHESISPNTPRLNAANSKVIFGEQLPSIKEVNQLLIGEAMLRAKGNQSIAAIFLGISHQALSKRLKSTS